MGLFPIPNSGAGQIGFNLFVSKTSGRHAVRADRTHTREAGAD